MANKVYNLSGGLYSGDAFTAFETQLAASKGGNLIASPADYKVTAGTGMNVSIAAGSAIIGNGTNSGIRVGSDTANTVAVSAASTANPREDAVVMYIDKSVSPSTSVTDNTDLGILKFKVVAGSPAASPNAPTASAIQSSIGAGNPYMILANITVPKSATAASGFTIKDMRVLPASLIPASAIGTDQLANAAVTSSKIDWTTLRKNFYHGTKTDNTALTTNLQYFASTDISAIPDNTVCVAICKFKFGDTGGSGNTVSGAIYNQNTTTLGGSVFYTNLSWGSTMTTMGVFTKSSSITQARLGIKKENSSIACNINDATLIVIPVTNA